MGDSDASPKRRASLQEIFPNEIAECRNGTRSGRFHSHAVEDQESFVRKLAVTLIERTFAWLNQFRRLRLRYEKRADMHKAAPSLACALICWKLLQGRFP